MSAGTESLIEARDQPLRDAVAALISGAAYAVCEPRRFMENKDGMQQELGHAVARARTALRERKTDEAPLGAEQICGRVADLIEGLGEIYTREGVHVWLTGRHRLLNKRAPLDVIREPGGLERVEALLDQLRSGAFV